MGIYFILLFLHFLTKGCFGQYNVVRSKLFKDLLNTNYKKQIMPSCEEGTNVTLHLEMSLRQIMEINEKDQTIKVNMWMRTKWHDCRLEWKSQLYSNVTEFNTPYETIWLPDITEYDSKDTMMIGSLQNYVTVTSTGMVHFNFPAVIHCICRIDVTYFPFDTQICNVTIGSWSYHVYKLDLIVLNGKGDLTTFVPNSEWDVIGMPAFRNVLHYPCCNEPFADITYRIILKRRPKFYILTIFFPVVLINAVALLSFLLPVECGEKVSLGITVLLSLTVFQLVVTDSMPATSESFPYLGIYFMSAMAFVSLSCLMTAIVVNVHFIGLSGGRQRVPNCIRIFFIDILGKLFCSRYKKYTAATERRIKQYEESETIFPETNIMGDSVSDDKITTDSAKDVSRNDPLVEIRRKIATRELTKNEMNYYSNEWFELANIVDKLCMLLYSITFIATVAAFIFILSNNL